MTLRRKPASAAGVPALPAARTWVRALKGTGIMRRGRLWPSGVPGKRFGVWPAALTAGVLLAVLPSAAASAHASGMQDVPRPAVPTAQGLGPSSGPVCSTDKADPTLWADPAPQLTAVGHLAAGSGQPTYLRAHFDVQVRQAPDRWTEAASALSALALNGQATNTLLTGPLSADTLYRFAASTWSYTADGTQHLTSPSTASTSGWCYFTVDPTAPLAPTVTSGGPYTACTADDCSPHGGPGVPGTFTFAPGAGDTGVVAYEYRLGDAADAALVDVPGSPVTVTLTPRRSGLVVLEVRAEDTTARWGPFTPFDFDVALPASSVGLWHFDDGQPGDTSTVAADTATGAGGRHAAALSGTGADWTALGRRGDGDGALALDGGSGCAATDGQILDPASSFAASVWVFPDDLAQDRTVLSQTGDDGSGFALGYAAAEDAWQFSYAWSDADGTRHVAVARADAGAARVWTQLAGSYDSAAHTLTLYVNGRPQGSPAVLPATATARTASGDLEFGRNATTGAPGGTYGAYWHGTLDEVQVWQRTLTADEALQDARLNDANGQHGVADVAAWNTAGASGTTLADTTTGYGRALTTEGGAQLDGSALVLDGVDGAAGTPGPVVDSSGAFTVTALVQPDMSVIGDKPDGWTGQVVGQRSADGSAWGLWYRLVGHTLSLDPDTYEEVSVPVTTWLFGRVGNDGTFTGATSQESTVWSPGTANDPVRLTGVFDAQSGTAELFTGLNQVGTAPFTPVPGTGDLTVGKAYLDGTWGSYFPGRVASLSLWAGAMSADQIHNLIGT